MTDGIDAPFAVHLRIITPEGILYEGDADWVDVPLEDGWIGVWPGHSPLVGAVARGAVRFAIGGELREIAVGDGVLRVDEERCSVLVGALGDEQATPAEDRQDQVAASLEDALYDVMSPEEIEELQNTP
jgi:F-type H+-transporting ATPase subunit epsilon